MAESRLDVVINPSKAQAGARAVKSSIDLMKQGWVEFTAKAFIAEQAIIRAFTAIKQGAEFEESFTRLNRQMANYGNNATFMVQRMKEVTSGQLSTAEATTAASRALSIGMNPDQIETFSEAAEALSDRMGGSVVESLDKMFDMMVTGKTKMLGNIKVFYDGEKAAQEYAMANNRTVDSMTKQEKAMLNAQQVTERLKKALKGMSDEQPSNADKLEAMNKRLDDMALKGKIAGSNLMMAIFAGRDKIADYMQQFQVMKDMRAFFDEHIFKDPQAKTLGKDQAQENYNEPVDKVDKKIASAELDGKVQRARELLKLETEEQKKQKDFQVQSMELSAQLLEESEFGVKHFRIAMNNENLQRDVEFAERELAILRKGYGDQQKIGFEHYEDKVKYEEKYQKDLQDLLNNEVVARNRLEEGGILGRKQTRGLVNQEIEESAKRLNDSLQSNFRIEEDRRHRSQDENIEYYQSLQELQENFFASSDDRMQTAFDLERAQLAKRLDLNEETAAAVLNAWRNHDFNFADELIGGMKSNREKDAAYNHFMGIDQDIKNQNDPFYGFAKGMQSYVNDKSMLGLGVDQARRVAQGMEQAFGTYFFDAMEGRIKSFKDVVQGLTDFAKNIVSQLAGQLITRAALQGIMGFGGMLIGGGGGGGIPANGFNAADLLGMPRHARGTASTNGPSIAGEGGPEAIVPLPGAGRGIPVEFRGGNYGTPMHMPTPTITMPVYISNEHPGASVEAQQRSTGNGSSELRILVRQAVQYENARGNLDSTNKQNFGVNRKPVRRG